MIPCRRLARLLPPLLASLFPLASASCQQVLGIHDVGLAPDEGPSGGETSSGTGGRPDAPGTGGGGAGGGGAGGGGAGGGEAGTPDFSLAVLTPNLTVPLGGKNVLEIEIRRTGGFSGEVTVMPVSPPVGLVIDPVTVPAGQTSVEITVGAEAPLALGNTVSFTLSGTSGARERTATVTDALITGRPGALDDTFGAAATGLAAMSFGADDGGYLTDIEVIAGKILATGWGVGGLGGSSMKVARLTGDGAMDPAFADGKLVSVRFGGSSGSMAEAHAVGHQLDGKIIAMGWHETPEPRDIALLRLGANGATGDALFGNTSGGKSLIDTGGSETVTDGLVLSNNKILVVGDRSGDPFVARASPDGFPDSSFGAGSGHVVLSPSFTARAVAVDAEGRILVAGHVDSAGQSDVVVARLLADGQPDPAFGTGGQRVIAVPGSSERAAALALLADGRIVVAGASDQNGDVDFQVRRLLEDGADDPSFGAGGAVTAPITGGDDTAEDIVLLPDSRILVVGNAGGGASPGPVLARYLRDGRIDANFGIGGVVSLYIGDQGAIHRAAVYPGQKVVVCGENQGGVPGPGTFGIVARLWM
ncbi:hypothetical protein WMF18_33280 [Sorangium sp. So ce315]|uniref:hypothetical protein n=1 Tax=Sorangium sp. So ce315 TaxID=3133299 RepID=UPI003F5F7891